MNSEKEKMRQGEWYDANYDPNILKDRLRAADLCFEVNQIKPSDPRRDEVFKKLFGQEFENLVIMTPFTCDYGKNITFGKDCFVNVNCYFMDGGKITLGDHVFVGPSTGFYTAAHPLDVECRNAGLEKALPITVGDNCRFGANVNVMPGVTIGEGCVIGAGSVVTHDIPPYSLAAGVPCKVMKSLKE